MAKYREKSVADLAWDDIRRTVQYRLNMAAATWKARKLNEILPELQDEFDAALNKGVVLELEAGAGSAIEGLLGKAEREADGR